MGGAAHGQRSEPQAKPTHGANRRDGERSGALFGRQRALPRCAGGGSRQWVFLYRRDGKLKEMGLGSPAKGVTLAMARGFRDEARAVMARGDDPLEARRAAEKAVAAVPTFGAYALALVERIEEGFSNPKHRQQWKNTLKTYCAPIWATPIDRVDTAGVLACLTPIWGAKPETASRVRGRIERVLNAAKAERLRAGEIRRRGAAIWTPPCRSPVSSRAAIMQRSLIPTCPNSWRSFALARRWRRWRSNWRS